MQSVQHKPSKAWQSPLRLRKLHHVVLLAEELHFARAAERANLSQSAFSRSIAAIEDEIGLRLFDRGPRFVRVTPIGERLIERAQRLLSSSADLRRELALLKSGDLGDVAVGGGPYSSVMLLAPAVAELGRRHPGVSVQLEVNHMRGLLEQLQSESLSFFVADVRDLPAPSNWQLEPLGSFPGGLYCRAGHPLARRRRLALADLRGAPLACVRLPAALHSRLAQMMQPDAPDEFRLAFECESSAALREYALQTDAVMISLASALRIELEAGLLQRLRVREFDDLGSKSPLSMELGLVRLRDRTATTSTRILIDIVREAAARLRD